MPKVAVLLTLISLAPAIFGAETLAVSTGPENTKTITLLFTNDLESTYDPVLAYWRDDMEHIGGIAQLATLARISHQVACCCLKQFCCQ